VQTASTAESFASEIMEAVEGRSAEFDEAADTAADAASWDNRINAVRLVLADRDLLRVPS
jgi:hypothetical protein